MASIKELFELWELPADFYKAFSYKTHGVAETHTLLDHLVTTCGLVSRDDLVSNPKYVITPTVERSYKIIANEQSVSVRLKYNGQSFALFFVIPMGNYFLNFIFVTEKKLIKAQEYALLINQRLTGEKKFVTNDSTMFKRRYDQFTYTKEIIPKDKKFDYGRQELNWTNINKFD